MLTIDPIIFANNLFKTQQYCHMQMSNMVADDSLFDNASVYRSFNPEINEKEIFEFGIELLRENNNTSARLCKTAYWTTDPLNNDWYIDNLYLNQIAHKDKCIVDMSPQLIYRGDIIISQIDLSVIDGASAAVSLYLFDDYDMPPIDTWFYLTKTPQSRLLFAWIPQECRHYANEAVLVNCVDCIGWFSEWYPDEYKRYYVPLY